MYAVLSDRLTYRVAASNAHTVTAPIADDVAAELVELAACGSALGGSQPSKVASCFERPFAGHHASTHWSEGARNLALRCLRQPPYQIEWSRRRIIAAHTTSRLGRMHIEVLSSPNKRRAARKDYDSCCYRCRIASAPLDWRYKDCNVPLPTAKYSTNIDW